MAHWIARVGSTRQRLDIDSTWLPGRGRATARQRERGRPQPLPLLALPTIWRRGHTFGDSASGRIFARCQHPERATRGRCPGGAGARVRDAAQRLRLDGSAGHRIVDLLQEGKVVPVVCADVLLGFLPASNRTARLDGVPREILRALSGPCRTRGPPLAFPASNLNVRILCSKFRQKNVQ